MLRLDPDYGWPTNRVFDADDMAGLKTAFAHYLVLLDHVPGMIQAIFGILGANAGYVVNPPHGAIALELNTCHLATFPCSCSNYRIFQL